MMHSIGDLQVEVSAKTQRQRPEHCSHDSKFPKRPQKSIFNELPVINFGAIAFADKGVCRREVIDNTAKIVYPLVI